MSGPFGILERLDPLLAAEGLMRRGGVRFAASEAAPQCADGRPAAAVVLVGVAGDGMWPRFSAWRETADDGGGADPLDRWSEVVLDPIAAKLGAIALYPSREPYQPFQSWAMRAEGLKASPLGLLIHPVFGLWHSYRGALAFAEWPSGVDAPEIWALQTIHATAASIVPVFRLVPWAPSALADLMLSAVAVILPRLKGRRVA